MQTIFVWLTGLTDVLLSWIPRSWDLMPLTLISILVGFLVLIVYRTVSSPSLIRKSKDKIKAHILAIRLYKNEWRVILKSVSLSLFWTVRYFALNMIPLLILVPLLAPLFAQLEVRYGISPVEPGALVEIKGSFSHDLDGLEPELIAESWYRPVMAPVYVYARNEAHWRIEILEPGVHRLGIKTSQGRMDKLVRCGDTGHRPALSQKRHRGHILAGLLYPVEPAFEVSEPAYAIQINYPGRHFEVVGLTLHWIWLHLLVVIAVALSQKKRFGIEF